MKLRTKLLLGYAGFVLALGVLGAWSARTLNEMSAVSGRIIAENYDSVVAAQDMKESLERQDSAALFELLGQHERAARQAAEHRARFDAAFEKAAANITETGRTEIIDAIRRGRDEYYRLFDEFLRASGDRTGRVFPGPRAALQRGPRRLRSAPAPEPGGDAPQGRRGVRDRATLVLHHARAWRSCSWSWAWRSQLSLSNAIVGPVRQLTEATTKIAAGDLDAAVPVHRPTRSARWPPASTAWPSGSASCGARISGKLLIAQQTTEAAIDSLYDPVIVTDGDGRVTRINPAAERLFGARPGIVGKPIEQVARDARIAQAVTDVLRSGAGRGLGERRRGAAVGRRRRAARVSRPLDADARCRRSPGRRGHAARRHHASQRNQPAQVRIHRRRVARAADAAHERADGHPPAARRRRRPARRRARQEILQVCREDAARLDRLDAPVARSVEDRIGVASTPIRQPVRPSVLVREAADSLRLQVEAKGFGSRSTRRRICRRSSSTATRSNASSST